MKRKSRFYFKNLCTIFIMEQNSKTYVSIFIKTYTSFSNMNYFYIFIILHLFFLHQSHIAWGRSSYSISKLHSIRSTILSFSNALCRDEIYSKDMLRVLIDFFLPDSGAVVFSKQKNGLNSSQLCLTTRQTLLSSI